MVGSSESVVTYGERFSDEYIGNLLAAVGNHEGKAVVLTAMQPGESYGVSALHRLYVDAQGMPPVHIGATNNQMDYCIHSLEPIGAVAKVTDAGSLQYEITDEGENCGKALTGMMLDFSLRHPDISLSQIFGPTQTKNPDHARSPLRRLELLRAMLNVTNATQIDLQTQIGRSYASVMHNIDDLLKTGVVVKLSQTLGEYEASFTLQGPIDKYAQVGSQVALTQATVNVLNILIAQDKPITQRTVQAALKEQFDYGSWVDESLRSATSKVLAGLVRQDVIEKEGEFDRWKRTKVGLHPDKVEAVHELMDLLNLFQNADEATLEFWRNRAENIIRDPQLVRQLIGKAIEHSPQANKQAPEERMAVVVQYLSTAYTATTKDIIVALGGKGVPEGAVRSALENLRKTGRVESLRVGSAVLWALRVERE